MNKDNVAELPHGEDKSIADLAEAITEMKRKEKEDEEFFAANALNIHINPRVYLISTQRMNYAGLSDFQRDYEVNFEMSTRVASQNIVEMAGRLCYMSFKNPRPGGNEAYINHILEVGHGSVLEHSVFGMVFTGVSRSLTHELVRHRAGMSYSQLSQRYVDEADCAFVLPPGIGLATKEYFEWVKSVRTASEAYQSLVKALLGTSKGTAARKKAREAARAVLPNCTETKIFVTGNVRAWRHFLELRGSSHADAEMQALAAKVLDVLRTAAPNLFRDYSVTEEGIQTQWRKV